VIVSSLQPDARPLSQHRLSQLLGRWADVRRLDPRQAEAIRQQIVAVPEDLGFDWWWRLLDPEHGSAFQATAWAGFSDAFVPHIGPPTFEIGAPGLGGLSQDEPDYRPYLRLT
jgi:hypothetical protein